METLSTTCPDSQVTLEDTPPPTEDAQKHQEPESETAGHQTGAEKEPPATSSQPRTSALGNKLLADICEETPTTPLEESPPTTANNTTTAPHTESQAAASAIDPLTEHLQTWHLSADFNAVLDKLHTGRSEELEAKHYVDYKMEEELVGNILRELMNSTMLIYFTEKPPLVFSVKAWATREFQENQKWPIEQVHFLGGNFFLIAFKHKAHRTMALKGTPWFIYRHFVFLAP